MTDKPQPVDPEVVREIDVYNYNGLLLALSAEFQLEEPDLERLAKIETAILAYATVVRPGIEIPSISEVNRGADTWWAWLNEQVEWANVELNGVMESNGVSPVIHPAVFRTQPATMH